MSAQPERLYTTGFFAPFVDGANRSAAAIFGALRQYYEPNSAVDVGCGQGAWVAALRAGGLERVLGIDGDYVDRAALKFPGTDFVAMDLANPGTVAERFDLALSMEVAEHLPAASADRFVAFLTSLAPVVLFSAAVPGQDGVGHINPQWQGYWVRRFGERGYVAVDCVRPRIWHDESVYLHYRQNTLLYVRNEDLASNPALARLATAPRANCLMLLDEGILEQQLSLREGLKRMPAQIRRWIARKARS